MNNHNFTDNVLMKPGIVVAMLFAIAISAFSQQRHPFSEEKVENDGWVFLPYTKGKVEKVGEAVQNPALEKVYSILTAWDSIAPPQGIHVRCHIDDNRLEMRFSPYIFQDGERTVQGSGPTLTIYADNPDKMLGNPIAPGVFLRPQKTGAFYGFPVYRTDIREVTIISNQKVPLFLPVTREEYLKSAIAEAEQKERNQNSTVPNQQDQLREVEKTYRELLKVDRAAAEEFKREMAGFTVPGDDHAKVMSQSLKDELSGMTAEERKQPAYYGGGAATERFNSPSGLVPPESRDYAEALVRPNPELTAGKGSQNIQLLVISWNVGSGSENDNPRDYSDGRTGFNLADNLMFRLYNDQNIWNRIFSLVSR
jgi:hypothetical protein